MDVNLDQDQERTSDNNDQQIAFEPHAVHGVLKIDLDWSEILEAFCVNFSRNFAKSKKAHFDSLPFSWSPDDKVVDGARVKWCLPLILDGIIYILEQHTFDLSRRRSFNQQRVLFESIWLVLQRKLTGTSPILCSLLRARQAGDLEAVQAIVKVSFSGEEELWSEGIDVMREKLLDEPCSKSAKKFDAIVRALCSHRALQQPIRGSVSSAQGQSKWSSAVCLHKALETAVCRAIAYFANYTPTSYAEKSTWKGRARGSSSGNQHLAQLALLGSLLSMAPDCDPTTMAVLSCSDLHSSSEGSNNKVRPVRRAKEQAAASMGRYRDADSDSEDEYVGEDDEEEKEEEALVVSEADDGGYDNNERESNDREADALEENSEAHSPRVSPADVTEHPALLSFKEKKRYHLRTSPAKVKASGKGKGKAAFAASIVKARSTGNLQGLSRSVNKASLATVSTDSELKKRRSDSLRDKLWKRARSADDTSALDDYHDSANADNEDENEVDDELMALHKSFDEDGNDVDNYTVFTSDALFEWQSLANEEHEREIASAATALNLTAIKLEAPAVGLEAMLWQSLDRPEPSMFAQPPVSMPLYYPQVMPVVMYPHHHAPYHHRGPNDQMMFLPSTDYYEHRRVSPFLYPGYDVPMQQPYTGPAFCGYQHTGPVFGYNAAAGGAGYWQGNGSVYAGLPLTPVSSVSSMATHEVASSSSSMAQDGAIRATSPAITPEVAVAVKMEENEDNAVDILT